MQTPVGRFPSLLITKVVVANHKYQETSQGRSHQDQVGEDHPFFSNEGCLFQPQRQQLRAEYAARGICAFVLHGWEEEECEKKKQTKRHGFISSSMVDSYVRYINYVLVPNAKRLGCYVKQSYYVFPVGLLKEFERGGPLYLKEHVSAAAELFTKDFWLIPYNFGKKHWSLVLICYPGVKERRFIAVLDSRLPHTTLEKISPDGFVKNARTFLVYMHLQALNLKPSDPYFDRSIACTEIVWINVPRQSHSNDCGIFLM